MSNTRHDPAQQLYNRYREMSDEGLVALYREGGFTAEGEATILRVLKERGLDRAELLLSSVDEKVVEEPVASGPSGLGGWLILLFINLSWSLLIGLFRLQSNYLSLFTDGRWTQLSDPASPHYDFLLSMIILWEMVFELALMTMIGVLIFLFFRKSYLFPKVYIWTLVASVVFSISDGITLSVLYGENYLGSLEWIARSAIWIAYVSLSKRVKNTFTQGRKKRESIDLHERETLPEQPKPFERLDIFNQWAENYNPSSSNVDFPFQGYDEVLDQVVEQADPTPAASVLDLGIGTGNLAVRFLPFDCAITGIDFSEKMLQQAAELLPDAELIQADLTAPFPPELNRQFDLIVAGYVLHEFDDQVKLSLIERLVQNHLKPKGRIVIGDISFPNGKIRELAEERWRHLWDHREHYWSAEEMCEQIEKKIVGTVVRYQQVSECAGVYTICRELEG
ncbi:MAG: DUF2569 family protein [Candidatus Kapaibacterium sp.]